MTDGQAVGLVYSGQVDENTVLSALRRECVVLFSQSVQNCFHVRWSVSVSFERLLYCQATRRLPLGKQRRRVVCNLCAKRGRTEVRRCLGGEAHNRKLKELYVAMKKKGKVMIQHSFPWAKS